MMNIKQSIAICALLGGVIVAGGAFAAQEILLAVMKLATQRCKEKSFEAAKDLLELARGMVSSE